MAYVTIDQLKDDLELGEHSETFANELMESADNLNDPIMEYSDESADIYNDDLYNWLKNDPDSSYYYQRAAQEHLFSESIYDDLEAQLRVAQTVEIQDELYANLDDIVKWKALNHLQEDGIESIDEDLASDIADSVHNFDPSESLYDYMSEIKDMVDERIEENPSLVQYQPQESSPMMDEEMDMDM